MNNKKKPKSIEAERFIDAVSLLIQKGYARNFKEVAEKSGYTSQDFTDLKAGKKDLKREFLDAVANNYPLNSLHIYTGDGETIITEIINKSIGLLPKGAVPYWNLPVSAGQSITEIVGAIKPDGYIKGLPGADIAENILPVLGASMEPEISSGALIGIRKMSNLETLNTERIYLIITRDDRMIKRIEHDPENDEILWCISPNYPRFKIYKSDIIDIQRVCFVYNPK